MHFTLDLQGGALQRRPIFAGENGLDIGTTIPAQEVYPGIGYGATLGAHFLLDLGHGQGALVFQHHRNRTVTNTRRAAAAAGAAGHYG